MSKLALLRNALKSGHSRQLRLAPAQRFLSAEAGSTDASSDDSFFHASSEGLVYAKICGRVPSVLPKHMLKTDLIHQLEGCDLTFHDIKFDYNRIFSLPRILVQFPSRASFENSRKQMKLRGDRLYMEKIDRREWDMKSSYDGKAVVMEGIPQNATIDDIERFLSGCNYESSSIQSVTRFEKGDSDPMRLVVVKFPTQLDASYAYASKNRSFCLSTPVSMHILQ